MENCISTPARERSVGLGGFVTSNVRLVGGISKNF